MPERQLLLFEGFQVSHASSDKSSMKMEMSMEHWWNETDREN
jgi:hypothetical protein